MLQLESKEFYQNKTDFNQSNEEHKKKGGVEDRILIKVWSPRDRWPAGGLFNSFRAICDLESAQRHNCRQSNIGQRLVSECLLPQMTGWRWTAGVPRLVFVSVHVSWLGNCCSLWTDCSRLQWKRETVHQSFVLNKWEIIVLNGQQQINCTPTLLQFFDVNRLILQFYYANLNI